MELILALAIVAAVSSSTYIVLRQKRLREQAEELAERVIDKRAVGAL